MNIGFEAKRIAQNTVGLGNYARNLIRDLVRFAPDLKCFLYSPRPFNPALADFSDLPSVVLRAPATKPNVLAQHWRRYHRVKGEMHADGIDLYHGLSNVLPGNLRCPAVVTIHDLIFLRHPEYYRAFDRWTYHRTFKRAARQAHLIFAVSQATKEDICTFFNVAPEKVVVTYQACGPEFDRAKITQSELDRVRSAHRLPEKFILHLGTLEARKNAGNLVRGFARAAERLAPYHLVFVGRESRYGATVKRLVAELGVTGRVHFLSFVPGEDLPALYALADLFAYISLIEGFGIPILEAMQCGTPSLTANRSSLKEVGGEQASILVDPLDVEAISHGLSEALLEPAVYRRLLSQMDGQAKKFSPEIVTQRVLEAYRSLAD